MIRFFESLALSAHYHSAVTSQRGSVRWTVLDVRPSGLVEAAPPRWPIPSADLPQNDSRSDAGIRRAVVPFALPRTFPIAAAPLAFFYLSGL